MVQLSLDDYQTGFSPAAAELEVFLKPEQNFFQPLKIKITARKSVEGQEQRDKHRGPFPADNFLLARLDQEHRGEDVNGGGDGQAGEHQKPAGGGVGELKVAELVARGGRQADEQKRQEHTVRRDDQNAVHRT